jgi:hypothetical protein
MHLSDKPSTSHFSKRPRKVRVPIATSVQEEYSALDSVDQRNAKVLYKKFTTLAQVPIPKEWTTEDVKASWSLQLLKAYKEHYESEGIKGEMLNMLTWVMNNPYWVKELWSHYNRGKQKYKNPCDKFCKTLGWFKFEYGTKLRIHALEEKQALEQALEKEERRNAPSRREYMFPTFEDHPEIEVPDDGNEYYLVRKFGGGVELRIKPQSANPQSANAESASTEQLRGRHNPQTGLRDLPRGRHNPPDWTQR